MSDAVEEHRELRRLWDLYCSILAKRGLDIQATLLAWADEKREPLKEFVAESCFDDLCAAGCKPLPLAIILALIRPLRSFETKWKQITGPPRKREQRIRAMEKAADALEDLLELTADTLLENLRGSVDSELLELFQKDVMNPSKEILNEFSKDDTVPHPATTIKALRLYASFLRMFESLEQGTGVDSTEMFSKYLISAYVRVATGDYHDAEVSALIGATHRIDYEETAHRMWRSRNFKRIDNNLSRFIHLLVGFGIVSGSRT